MKRIQLISLASLIVFGLAGCLASTTSPDGVNCGPTQSKPIWEKPLACQGGN